MAKKVKKAVPVLPVECCRSNNILLFPSIREAIRERKENKTIDYLAADRERADRIVRCAFSGCRIGKVPKIRCDSGLKRTRNFEDSTL